MRIIVISNLYPPHQLGGYEIACRNVVNGLRVLGHQVQVLTSPSHLDDRSGQTEVFRRLQLRAFQPISAKTPHERLESAVTNYTNTSVMLDQIMDFQPDCVLLFNIFGLGGLALMDSLNTLQYPWVMYLMDRLPQMMQHGINLDVLALYHAGDKSIYRTGKFICMSRHLLTEIQKMCGTGYPFDTDFIPGWSDVTGAVSHRIHAPGGVVRFVNAGALQPHKGIHLIIQAAAMLKKSGVRDFMVDFYGEGEQGLYIDMCKQHQVSDKVSFHGLKSQNELTEIYRNSDVFLFPTHDREPFGFAPVEAAAVGCVPIISQHCGAAERFIDKVNCFKIERNVRSLSKVMTMVCAEPSILRALGRNAESLTRQDLSFSHCLAAIERVLRTTVFRKHSCRPPTWKDHNLAYLKHNLAIKLNQ